MKYNACLFLFLFTSDDPCLDQPAPQPKTHQEDTEGNQVDFPVLDFCINKSALEKSIEPGSYCLCGKCVQMASLAESCCCSHNKYISKMPEGERDQQLVKILFHLLSKEIVLWITLISVQLQTELCLKLT